MAIAPIEYAPTTFPVAADRYREWFEDNPLPMWVFDTDTFSFLEVNEAAVRRYGYTRGEFLSMTILDIRPPEDVSILVSRIHEGHHGRTQKIAGRHCTKTGKLIEVEVYAQPVRWQDRPAEVVQVQERVEVAVQYLSDLLRQMQDMQKRATVPMHDDALTPREHEVLEVLALGKSNKEVAATLGISIYTAQTHRRNIMQKLNLHSVAQLTRYALRKQL